MQFRVTRTNYKGKIQQYGQIVESYRRELDGMPTHRIVRSLGPMTDIEVVNFKAAFNATRAGKVVRVVEAAALAAVEPVWTRPLLDICACLQAWQDLGFDEFFRDLFGGHDEDAEPTDVLAALVMQRCIEPSSKLGACRWFPRTTLPELLGISPALFHNSRVHRVLERLEACDGDLQNSFANKMLQVDGKACTAFFIDCTDTWFTGRGPEMARRGKTKEEFYRRKVGIILLCRQDGMPLRFKVIRGNTDDGVAMLAMLGELRDEPWLGGAPLVCDRALGNTADLLDLIDLDVQFVTALVASEHAAYGALIDCPALSQLDHKDTTSLDKAGALVMRAGMTRYADDLYVLEKSLIQKDQAIRTATGEVLDVETNWRQTDDLTWDMLQLARSYRAAVESGKVPHYAALQRGVGRSNGHMDRVQGLLRLPADIQAQIDAGVARNLTQTALVRMCQGRNADLHRAQFARECAAAKPKRPWLPRPAEPVHDAKSPWVQAAVAFNPQLWKRKREKAQEREDKLARLVERLNVRLSRSKKANATEFARDKVMEVLKKMKLRHVYSTTSDTLPEGISQLKLQRDEEKWKQIRGRDGFQVVVSSPDVTLSAVERVRLYRSKDKIEKDFQEIKSVLELRPVRHRTDAKVRAHVTICVLALCIQHQMRKRLLAAGRTESTERAVEEMHGVHLCGLKLADIREVIVAPTLATVEQKALASALGVEWALAPATLRKRLITVRD